MRGCLGRMLLVATLAWSLHAQTAAYEERDVQFHSNRVTLAGTLVMPQSPGPHPAIVVLHGSGPATREGGVAYGREFAALGIATFAFDKRGCGRSGGDWTQASLDDLAADASAAVAYLRTTAGIDAKRVGFFGVSQAAWVATAAARPSNIAFMVLVSGGGASPRESETYAYLTAFERAGLGAAEIAEAMRVIDRYMNYLATGDGRDALVAELNAAHDRAWSQLAPLERILPSPENRAHWQWVATWSPDDAIAHLTCPILLLFGDRDTEQPTAIAVARWREGLRRAGNTSYRIVVFPGAGHGIRMRDGFTGNGRAPFADGYEEVITGWLWRNVVTAK
ncbi:MAG: alpha/beta fold hydrolase [Acidobacteria bacterium]|nr:alpha/beta fold hydrolase [Acidobacteriota bacterium]MBV9475234.1 alpha/beta fold hydrolase [Acidobacteriota bacterium]